MKKKVGIVDKDDIFFKRLKDAIYKKYEDVEIYYFPTMKSAQTAAKKFILNLLLVDTYFVDGANSNLIPNNVPYKIVVVSNEDKEKVDCPLPLLCKYRSMEEWYKTICEFCSCESSLLDQGGEEELLQTTNCPVCLFLSCGDGNGATFTSAAFCHFLIDNRFKRIAAFEPYLESGENVWRMLEPLKDQLDLLMLCENKWDKDGIVIPFINSNFVVFVTDGSFSSNEKLKKILKELPIITGLSKEEVFKKSALLYNDFDPTSGGLFEDKEMIKLGGIDTEKNKKASFEKLVGILGVRRD